MFPNYQKNIFILISNSRYHSNKTVSSRAPCAPITSALLNICRF